MISICPKTKERQQKQLLQRQTNYQQVNPILKNFSQEDQPKNKTLTHSQSTKSSSSSSSHHHQSLQRNGRRQQNGTHKNSRMRETHKHTHPHGRNINLIGGRTQKNVTKISARLCCCWVRRFARPEFILIFLVLLSFHTGKGDNCQPISS